MRYAVGIMEFVREITINFLDIRDFEWFYFAVFILRFHGLSLIDLIIITHK